MKVDQIVSQFKYWVGVHSVELIISLIILVLFFISRRVIKSLIKRHSLKHNFDKSRSLYVNKITGLANFLLFGVLMGFTWEVSLSGLGVYFASIFTIVGVALFAHWSILSNLTASVVLFFFFHFKIGSHIRIQDGDNSIEGMILDITMFYLQIETEDGRKVNYPNNLALQKATYHIK